jgi:hypothetical protein
MTFSKALLVALRSLPKRYVEEDTMAVEYGPRPGCVVVANGKKGLPLICYHPKHGKKRASWRRIKFHPDPMPVQHITGIETLGSRTFVFTPKSIHASKP